MTSTNNKAVNFAEIFHVKDITTKEMQDAINEWHSLYYGENIYEFEDPCQRIAYTVVTKLTKTVFAEYEAESENEFAQSVLTAFQEKKKEAMRQALIGGVAFLKPLIFDDKLTFNVIPRRNVIVLGRNDANEITDIGTIEETEDKGKYYTFYERRRVNEDGKLEITSVLYMGDERGDKGRRVPLNTLAKYDGIDEVNIINIDNIGLIPLVCPIENCVDGSDEPVSVYAAAVGLIHNINTNEYQLNGEFKRGESRVIVSSDMLKRDVKGNEHFMDNVFTGIDDDPENVGVNIFAPALRDASFLARKREYLRNVETIIGFKRGILSEVEAADRTAKEITSSEGDYNLTIIDFQEAFETMVRHAINVCAELYKAYNMGVSEVKDEDVIISWGNGVLYDRAVTWREYLEMVAAGILKPEIAIAFYFNISWKNEKDLEKIRADYMPQMIQLLEG